MIKIDENSLIEIPPFIYHEVHALTDITLIEFNSEENDFVQDAVKL
ncbi:MAG: hypothetical protein HY518_01615 [Candidatus Aenigmarchaeota archaeon]|nr:hypothetical protein [Candidatus Aenigmarchaeota archaeon]